jgi:YD repeat-containing protein
VSGEAASNIYTYDAFDDTLTAKDGLNYTTTYTYDNVGNLISVSKPIDATTNATTTYSYDAFRNLLNIHDPLGNDSYFFYDHRNLQILALDQERYGTGTTYNARGEAITVTRYFTKYTGTITPGVTPTMTTNSTEDAITTFGRDFLGRVHQLTDAMGNIETYEYDDLDRRVSLTNKLGG